MLSLEAVMMLPILALLIMALMETAVVIRDVLVVHEAARAGARAAATTTGTDPVFAAARRAAPELTIEVSVDPVVRGDGDIAVVTVTARRLIGPMPHTIEARGVARVEPAVGTTARHGVPP
jgi:Flp pilus assembly protein TadG